MKPVRLMQRLGLVIHEDHRPTYGDFKLDRNGFIKYASYCDACGYNLRGLRPDGACPECGTPLPQSVRTSSFQFHLSDLVCLIASITLWVVAMAEHMMPVSRLTSIVAYLAFFGGGGLVLISACSAFRSRLIGSWFLATVAVAACFHAVLITGVSR